METSMSEQKVPEQPRVTYHWDQAFMVSEEGEKIPLSPEHVNLYKEQVQKALQRLPSTDLAGPDCSLEAVASWFGLPHRELGRLRLSDPTILERLHYTVNDAEAFGRPAGTLLLCHWKSDRCDDGWDCEFTLEESPPGFDLKMTDGTEVTSFPVYHRADFGPLLHATLVPEEPEADTPVVREAP